MQKRATSGKEFENLISEKYGKRVSKSPRIVWNGVGRTNIDKIISLNFDMDNFYPTDKSNYSKYDLIGFDNNFYEIKKYKKEDLKKNWILYSEPIIKVGTKSTLESIIKKFGNGDLDKAIDVYNNLIYNLHKKLNDNGTLEKIKNEIIKNTTGMFIIDDFIKMEDIVFRWVIQQHAWKGFHRITLEFKLK